MGRVSFIAGFLLLFLQAESQVPVGSWTDHLAYNTAQSVAVGQGNVYASTGSSIIVYNREFSELKRLSKVNGLSETGISSIAWSEENSMLIIAYENTNIDLVHKSIIYNIPDIMNKFIPGKKRINRVRTYGTFAYLASGFGIVVADPVKKEIKDTWRPGPDAAGCEVYDIAFGGGRIYAATEKGVWYADITDPGLSYFGNWNRIHNLPSPDNIYTHIIYAGGRVYVNESNPSPLSDIVYAVDKDVTTFESIPDNKNKSLDQTADGFTISSPGSVRHYSATGALRNTISSYGWGVPNISQGIIEGNGIWLADLNYGLIRGENLSLFTNLALTGPAGNNVTSIVSGEGTTILCGGGADRNWTPLGRSFQVSVNRDFTYSAITSGTVHDPMRAVIMKGNSRRFFVSTWGSGVLEYENNILKNHYTPANSPLQQFIPGTNDSRICGIAADPSGNLWIAQSGSTSSIRVLKADGSWISIPIQIDAPVAGDMIITSAGHKWIILPGGYGIFILDDNKTPENFSDDRYKRIPVRDSENRLFPSLFSLAEDLDGTIWIGTDQGPVIYHDPVRIFEDDPGAARIKIPRDDGTGLADYLLGTEIITSIAVDGGNRKWLATAGSGAYLISGDGTALLKHYTRSNSPLLSDSLTSVAVDQKSGEVWFGTSRGVVSLRGEATSGADRFTQVYAFPNPVREDFHGNVTITGLIRNTRIKITDISGNLVGETVSEGGQASWDLKGYNGQRVSTGVYIIFGSSSDGSSSFVTKILVVR